MSTIAATAETIDAKTAARIRSYFEARDDWNLSRSLKNLIGQAIRDYEHRAVLELVQNAHDAQPAGSRDGRILIRLDYDDGEHGSLVVANTGTPFTASNFEAICDVAQSDKRADEGIGNKGIGFKSTLQLCRIPEVYSASDAGSGTFDGYCFRFANDDDLLAAVDGNHERARDLGSDVFHLCLPVSLTSVPQSVHELRSDGYVSVIRLPLKSEAAREEALDEIVALEQSPPTLLFLRRISQLVVEERQDGEMSSRTHGRDEGPVVALGDRTTVTEVLLDEQTRYIVAERVVDPVAFREAIKESVEADRISAGWDDWSGEARVGVGVPTGEPLTEGRLYTFLPMGEHATSPLPAHVNAPFFAKLARVSLEESVPLNDFLLDEVATLAAAVVLGASDGAVSLEPTTVADLVSWVSPTHERFVSAFDRLGTPLNTARVLPLRAVGTWGTLAQTRWWPDDDWSVMTAEAIEASRDAAFLDDTIRGERLERLSAAVEAIAGSTLSPTDDEIADWAEAIAAASAKRKFSREWWERFYDELAGANSDRAALQGRKILIDDDLRLQRCAGSEKRGPTPFFSPRAEDASEEDADDDLRIPRTLNKQIVFVNQQLRWTQRSGTTSVRRPGRRMLDPQTAGLVHEYRASELFGVLNRALRNRPSAARARDALRWSYLFVRSRDDPPWSDISSVAFQVPTVAGDWIEASKGIFSRGWGGPEDQLLDEFIEKVSGLSEDLDSLATRLVPSPSDWPFEIDSPDEFRRFLERLGVRTGLWPQPAPRSALTTEGRFYEDLSAHTGVPLPPVTRTQWRSALERRPPIDLRPYTNYRSVGPQHVLPGQAEFEEFDDATRRLYAQLVAVGLDNWDDTMLDVVIRRYNDSTDRFSWPTPARAFLEEVEWVPMARPGDRQTWHFVRVDEAWSHGVGDDNPPNFAPLLPHALRRLTELRPRSRIRLEELGVRFWDATTTAPDRVLLLARLLRDGDLGDAAAAPFRKAYEEAWEDVVQSAAANPFDGVEDDDKWVVTTIRSQLVAAPLTGEEAPDHIYVQDADSPQALRLLEQRSVPLIRLRRGIGGAVAEMLGSVAGERIRKLSSTGVTVRVDGEDFMADGSGDLLVDERLWLVDLVSSITELRSGSFRRLGTDAVRRTRETVQRTRLVLAEHIETLVDGSPVEGSSRALALPDPFTPTIVVERDASHDEAELLQTAAAPIAELIGYPDLDHSLRLCIIDLAQRNALTGDGPSLSTMAEVLGEPEARLRQIAVASAEPLEALARTLVPLVATLDVDVASELWSSLDSFPDEAALGAWLGARTDASTSERLIALSTGGNLDSARIELDTTLRELNAAIDALGPPFEPLRNPDGIEQAFHYFVHRNRDVIIGALRAAFRETYEAFGPLDEYVGRRDLSALRPDPTWVDDFYDLPDEVIRSRVARWLDECGAVMDDVRGDGQVALDDMRRSNRGVLHETVAASRELVRAWEAHTDKPSSGLPGEPEAVVDLATESGYLDFELLSAEKVLAWLDHLGRWPGDMPRSLDPEVLGVPAAELDAARKEQEDEEKRRHDKQRQISIDGVTVDAAQENYAAIVDAIRAGITPDLLASPPSLVDLPEMPPAGGRGGGTRAGRGVTAARRRRLSDIQAGAVGLAGEVVALEWLKANYEEATDASWRSGYRNLLLGGTDGDDSLGFDFEVVEPRRRLMFEVKASVSDACEFDLTESEIHAAQRCRRADRYFILYITHVLTSDERKVHLLPNPLSAQGLGRYRTVGSGLRLRFQLDQASG